jgi:hypothetical protein
MVKLGEIARASFSNRYATVELRETENASVKAR